MPMDGFTLSFMERELAQALTGGRVDRVNQPERDTLVLLVRNQGSNMRLLLTANADQARAQLTEQAYENPAEPPMFCMLMRKHLQGSRLAAIRQWKADRVLMFTFDCLGDLGDPVQKTLIFEMMGRYSNLTLVDDAGAIIDSIRHVSGDMSRVRLLVPGAPFEMPPAQDKLDPSEMDAQALSARLSALSQPLEKALIASVYGIAGVCAREICAQLGLDGRIAYDQQDAPKTAEALLSFYRELPARFAPCVQTDSTGLAVDFLPFPYISLDMPLQKPAPTLSAALDAFYSGRDLRLRMRERSSGLQKQIKNHLSRLEKKQSMMFATLAENEKAEKNRIYGELLTANLHALPKGADHAEVVNYYDEAQQTVSIPLSTQLTPAQNAQNYYKKYRKAKGAEQYAREQLTAIAKELEFLENVLDDLDKCDTAADLSEIRELLSQNGYLRPEPGARKQKKPVEGKPYRFPAADGTDIFVGKNALQNDRLTLHARGDETWLHAQGVPGSHVLIKTEKEPAPDTLLYAAKLAAYYSKGRNRPGQPVDYTRRKYIKKAGGSPAGFVTYTNFQTIWVTLSPEESVAIGKCAAQGGDKVCS